MQENNYLAHYGVKGMKWGVRKDIRLIANSQRNRKVTRIKNDYERGRISREKRNISIQKANDEKKRYMSTMEDRYRNAKSSRERDKLEREVRNTAIKEVNNRGFKKGLSLTSEILMGYGIGSVTAGAVAVSTVMPAVAPMMLGAAAIDSAVYMGLNALAQMGLDKLS